MRLLPPGKTFGIIDWANAFVEQGCIDDFEFDDRMGVLCDPQTSGGLLVAIPPENASFSRRNASSAKGANPPESESLKPVRRVRSS